MKLVTKFDVGDIVYILNLTERGYFWVLGPVEVRSVHAEMKNGPHDISEFKSIEYHLSNELEKVMHEEQLFKKPDDALKVGLTWVKEQKLKETKQ